jgi:hypothetical protein
VRRPGLAQPTDSSSKQIAKSASGTMPRLEPQHHSSPPPPSLQGSPVDLVAPLFGTRWLELLKLSHVARRQRPGSNLLRDVRPARVAGDNRLVLLFAELSSFASLAMRQSQNIKFALSQNCRQRLLHAAIQSHTNLGSQSCTNSLIPNTKACHRECP